MSTDLLPQEVLDKVTWRFGPVPGFPHLHHHVVDPSNIIFGPKTQPYGRDITWQAALKFAGKKKWYLRKCHTENYWAFYLYLHTVTDHREKTPCRTPS